MKKTKKKKITIQSVRKALIKEVENYKRALTEEVERRRLAETRLDELGQLVGVGNGSHYYNELRNEVQSLQMYKRTTEGTQQAAYVQLYNENSRLFRLVRIAMKDSHVGKLPEDSRDDDHTRGRHASGYQY